MLISCAYLQKFFYFERLFRNICPKEKYFSPIRSGYNLVWIFVNPIYQARVSTVLFDNGKCGYFSIYTDKRSCDFQPATPYHEDVLTGYRLGKPACSEYRAGLTFLA